MHKSSPFRALLVAAALSGAMAACTPAVASRADEGERRGTALRADIITAEEMAELSTLNLYQLVERLRPRWLRRAARSLSGGDELAVFQDATYLGGPEVLRQYQPGMARRLRFLDAATAMSSLPGLASRRIVGAIVIETR